MGEADIDARFQSNTEWFSVVFFGGNKNEKKNQWKLTKL